MVTKSNSAYKVTLPSDREILITRIFDAPRERVFQAWTDPVHLQKWWGPEAFCNPRCEWEMKPGGEIRVDMRMFDGTVYPIGYGKINGLQLAARSGVLLTAGDGRA